MKPAWIKWYPVLWLHSTARDELRPEERAVWLDFVCLAAVGNEPGTFKFVSLEGLARQLNTPVEIVEKTIEKLKTTNRIKIKKTKEGHQVEIIKWQNYQPFNGEKAVNQKPAGEDLRLTTNSIEKRREDKRRKEKNNKESEPAKNDREENKQDESEPGLLVAPDPAAKEARTQEKEKIAEIIAAWNKVAARHRLPQVTGVASGTARERHLRAAIKRPGFNFQAALDELEKSPFLLGLKTDFKATFDWVIKPGNYQKIIEGTYRDNRPAATQDKIKALLEKGKEKNL